MWEHAAARSRFSAALLHHVFTVGTLNTMRTDGVPRFLNSETSFHRRSKARSLNGIGLMRMGRAYDSRSALRSPSWAHWLGLRCYDGMNKLWASDRHNVANGATDTDVRPWKEQS